jgi:hypothetical protein
MAQMLNFIFAVQGVAYDMGTVVAVGRHADILLVWLMSCLESLFMYK